MGFGFFFKGKEEEERKRHRESVRFLFFNRKAEGDGPAGLCSVFHTVEMMAAFRFIPRTAQ